MKVKDYILQPAISLVMIKYYDNTYAESIYGFRPKRKTRIELKEAERHIYKEGLNSRYRTENILEPG